MPIQILLIQVLFFIFSWSFRNHLFLVSFVQVDGVKYRRERSITPDEDFLNLDWSELEAIAFGVSPVLEGDSMRQLHQWGLV